MPRLRDAPPGAAPHPRGLRPLRGGDAARALPPPPGGVPGLIGATRGRDEVELRILAALEAGPRTGGELARALDAAAPGLLEGREGGLYPVLAGLEIRGAVESRWTEDAAGRPRREHFLPDVPCGPAAPASLPPAPPDARLARIARECARGVPGSFERESARAEILAHLEASAAAWAATGAGAETAMRRAVESFGDPWKIGTDLARVHRGRPVVLFPATVPEQILAVTIYDLPGLIVLVALVLLLRWQVVQAYNIPTGSMEPTLHGDEKDPDLILVDKTAFLRRDPERWDVIVFYPPPGAESPRAGESDRTAFVKRCVGLGGESLDIRGGDLYADGRLARRPDAVEEAMMVPAYDWARDLAQASSRSRSGLPADMIFDETWRMTTGSWSIPGAALAAVPGEEGEARLRYIPEIDNSFTDIEGHSRSFPTKTLVGDAEVRFVLRPGPGAKAIGADLTEGEERHVLRLTPEGLTLRSGERTWTRRGVRLAPGRRTEIRFRNVDDRLTAWVDGERVLREELPPRAVLPAESASAGVELVAEGGPATFEGVRLRRDVGYMARSSSYSSEAEWPRRIPEGEFFFMGDNTGSSRDSRVWGTVPRKDLIGAPFWVVFPPSRAKVLR